MTASDSSVPHGLDLRSYVPYYINMISNKLTHGSARLYARQFGVGVLEWRVIGYLKMQPGASANEICNRLAIDKAAASRAVKLLEEKALIDLAQVDGRRRSLSLTRAGARLHDRMLRVALQRERILLASLSQTERTTLLDLLRKLSANLVKLPE